MADRMSADTLAVSDVLGSILLVGITVASFAGLSLLVFNIPGPADPVHAQVNLQALPGPDQAWGTGDEIVQLKHLYGEPIPVRQTSILVSTNGVVVRYSGADLAFSDNELNAGERWVKTVLLNFNDEVTLGLVVGTETGTTTIASSTQIVGKTSCTTDTSPPRAVVTQSPANLEASTTTDVIVTAVLVDACNGVDITYAPSLVYTVGLGSPVAMTHTTGTTFVGTILQPAAGWSDAASQTLQYHIAGMRDLIGNVGDSPTTSDLIDPFPPQSFLVASGSASPGQLLSFAFAQNDTDDGAFATLTESYSSAPNTTLTMFANAWTVGNSWSNQNDASKGTAELDTSYAKYKLPNQDAITFNLPSPGTPTTTIKQVTISGSGYIKDAQINDGWRLTGCIPTGCTQLSGVYTAASTSTGATTFTYDVTGLRPGGGTWTWADIEVLQIRVIPQVVTDATNGNINDGEWHLDGTWVSVLHGSGYEAKATFNWAPSEPVPSTNTIQLRYAGTGEQYQVRVRDPTQPTPTWNPRGSPLFPSASMTTWTTSLTDDEWNGGAVEIQIVSLQTSPTAQNTLKLDYLRVTSP